MGVADVQNIYVLAKFNYLKRLIDNLYKTATFMLRRFLFFHPLNAII